MATRKRSDRAMPRGQAQDRSAKTIGEPPAQQPPVQAPPQPDQSAPIQARTTQHQTPTRDEVAQRAYDLYQQRGGGDGRDLEDWLQAERDLQRQP